MLGYLRFILAVGVLISHAGLVSDYLSRTMVSAFFIISGYLMMLTLDKNYQRNQAAFYWNRFLRIYPLFWATLIGCLLVIPGIADKIPTEHGVLIGYATVFLFMGGTLLKPTPIVGPAWTLPYEIGYYAIAPYVKKAGSIGAGLFFATMAGAFLFFIDDKLLIFAPFAMNYASTTIGDYVAIFGAGVLFALGACTYFLQQRIVLAHPCTYAKTAIIIAITLMFVITNRALIGTDGQEVFDRNFALIYNTAICFAVMAFLLVWNGKESKRSQFFGDLCYPVYIIHYPVHHFLLPLLPFHRDLLKFIGQGLPAGKFFAGALLTFVVTLALSTAWVYVERRTVRRLKLSGKAI